jgi:hypothetical protein
MPWSTLQTAWWGNRGGFYDTNATGTRLGLPGKRSREPLMSLWNK